MSRSRRNTEKEERNTEQSCLGNEILSTKRVLRNMAIMVPSFYIIFYSIISIVNAAFTIEVFDPKSPFNFKACCLKSPKEQALGISILVTYSLSTLFFMLITLQRFWDHAVTLTILHILITAAVMFEFPTNWQWWIALFIGFAIMLNLGELLCYCILKRKKRTPRADVPNDALT